MAGAAGGVVVGGSPAVSTDPVGPPGALCGEVVPTGGAQGPAGEETYCLCVSGGGAAVVSQRRIVSRGSSRVVGPHGKRDGVLGEGVVAGAAVRLRVEETLVLL